MMLILCAVLAGAPAPSARPVRKPAPYVACTLAWAGGSCYKARLYGDGRWRCRTMEGGIRWEGAWRLGLDGMIYVKEYVLGRDGRREGSPYRFVISPMALGP
jgi:hypothetical protein